MLLADFFTSAGMDENPIAYLFKWQHLLYIALSILCFILLMRLFAHKSEKTRKIIIIITGIILLGLKYGGEILFVTEWQLYGDQISSFSHPFWDWRTLISFQVCGINNVLLPLVVCFNIKGMKDFIYTSSIIGGIAAIIYPVGVLYGNPLIVTFPMIRSLVVHFLLVFLPCFLIVSGEFKLEKKNWKNTFIGALIISIWGMYGNIFVNPDANNIYLMRNPFLGGPIPLLNILPNGVHTVFLYTLVLLAFMLVYWISGKYNKWREKTYLQQ